MPLNTLMVNKNKLMNKIFSLTLLFFCFTKAPAQADSLKLLGGVNVKVYYSTGTNERAVKIAKNVEKAELYFKKQLNIQPDYTLWILSRTDWKKFAHPNAIYGIPHFLPNGKLVVAAEDNEFWKRNIPPLQLLPPELVEKVKQVYTTSEQQVSLQAFFDLLAIHELGHAFQKAAGLKAQRNWMGELLCNVLLHTFIAENEPQLLPALILFPAMTIQATDVTNLKYTRLNDFETYYNQIAQNHPDNYGWYQCKFHKAAEDIYNEGGVAAMKNLWAALLTHQEKLDDEAFAQMLADKAHPSLIKIIQQWADKYPATQSH